MKYIIITSIILTLAGTALRAQTDTIKIDHPDRPGLNPGFSDGGALHKDKKGGGAIWVGSGGVHYERSKPDSERHRIEVQFGMLDLGFNSLIDNTSYLNADQLGTKVLYPIDNVLRVSREYQNKDLFSLRQGKSINVNIYPIMLKANLYMSPRQKWMLATGLGLQLYNFRFTKPISYRTDPTPYVALDTISFSKNKLAFNYLMLPLMLNGKTKLASGGDGNKGYWLTYGVGVSGGYLLSSWTKQISDDRGKDKNHDAFNFRKTNLCVNGEIGLDGYIRLYASYQLTSLEDGIIDQHPLSIGIRFLGL